ncbi:NAD-dependent epimerase/dehydratase family protein [Streptomyces nigra]|uniref:NAD-dependent epimerase/dehydratase family protein n=1 Tax=Streptomyces TaxID=1883 RepID=UPI001F30D580|nr:NAD-dependent epimerase/dehydratase family protein [Streptomyces sp. FB2]MCF2540881.1 NAD-dependent epimerase/dehydratase family protein [Streptomyces sp. FB2]
MTTEDPTSIPEDATILVTGGSGFVGSHTVVRLLRAGHRTRVAVRGPAQQAQTLAALQQAGVDPAGRLTFAFADLGADTGWAQAMDGVTHVLHHASPFPVAPPKTEDEVLLPARDGALRVITAARNAGIARVVMTSSYAAIGYTRTPDDHYTEENWTDPETPGLPAYHKSKILAEAAAWGYVRAHGDIELVVINPTGIFGPQMVDRPSGSIGLIKAMLNGDMPVVPVMHFGVVDVRDVVDLHLRAMMHPKAAGERFIANRGSSSFFGLANILRERFPAFAEKLPARELTIEEVREAAKTEPALREAAVLQGRIPVISNDKARSVLGWEPREFADTITATAEALIELDAVHLTEYSSSR